MLLETKEKKMKQKTKYQYSYFIYPYIIEEEKYERYLLKLLRDKHCKLKIWEREKDFNIYTYFLPKVREYLFWSFSYSKEKKRKLEELEVKMKSTLLAKYPCTMFEYTLGEEIQGKVGEANGIFFDIQKIEIVCFQTGICFLLLKTTVEGENDFSDVLNFNYKFRDINSEFISLKNYENIRLQTNAFKDMKELSTVIKGITGSNKEAKEMNLEKERFLTYSYVCLDDMERKLEEEDFSDLKEEFVKFSNILPSNYQVNYSEERYRKQIWQPLKYTRMGFTKQGTVLLTTTSYPENYTKLPFAFEKEYLYTYLLTLYKKIYLKKMNLEFKKGKKTRKFQKAKEQFLDFTSNIWIQEITEDEEGCRLHKKWKETLELEYLYAETKNQYEMIYKDLTIGVTRKINYFLMAVLVGTLLFVMFHWL